MSVLTKQELEHLQEQGLGRLATVGIDVQRQSRPVKDAATTAD